MANLAGLGAFASGLAGGIKQGMENYAGLVTEGKKQQFAFDKFEWEKQSAEDTADLSRFSSDLNYIKTLTPDQRVSYIEKRKEFLTAKKKTELASLYDFASKSETETIKTMEEIIKNIAESSKNKDMESGQMWLERLGQLKGYDSPEYLRYKHGYAGKLYSILSQITDLKAGLRSGAIDPKSVTEEQKALLLIPETDLDAKFVSNAPKNLMDIYMKKLEGKAEIKSVMGPEGKPILREVTGREDKPYEPYEKPVEGKVTNASVTNKGVTAFFDPAEKSFKVNIGGQIVPYNQARDGLLPSSEQTKMNVANIRFEGLKEIYGDIRQTPVYDQSTGQFSFASANQIAGNPQRFMPPAQAGKTLNQNMLIEDIKGSIKRTKDFLAVMPEFTAKQAGQFALVMKSADPSGAMTQFMQSGVGQTLNPQQQDYIINLIQLKEQAMAMRSVLGAGQGSDMMREAIDKTTPSAATPNKAYAGKQLDAFKATLDRVQRFVPNVKPVAGREPTQNIRRPTITVGTIQKGYRFKGGNPGNPESWEKVK